MIILLLFISLILIIVCRYKYFAFFIERKYQKSLIGITSVETAAPIEMENPVKIICIGLAPDL